MQVFKIYIENQQTKNSNYFYYHNTFSVKLTPHLLLIKLLHALFWYSQLYMQLASQLPTFLQFITHQLLFVFSFFSLFSLFFFFLFSNKCFYLFNYQFFSSSLALGLAQHCYSRSASKFNINIQPSIPLKILFDFSVKVLSFTACFMCPVIRFVLTV